MDILYIVGQGSKWRDNELRYSLRSIEKNGINVGRVFIAGYIPPFINPKTVGCLRVQDKYTVKHYNILHAIEQAVENLPLSEHFLYSSDDHFYIAPTDFDAYPHYWRGVELPTKVEPDEKNRVYHTTLLSTRKLLECFDLPCHHFAWHGNTHFNTRLWNEPDFVRLRRLSYLMPEGCEPTCLMNNYWLAHEPFEPIVRQDLKLTSHETHATFMTKTEGREVCSSVNNISEAYLAEYLKNTFPDRSKYEMP